MIQKRFGLFQAATLGVFLSSVGGAYAATPATAHEFYNSTLNHYFVTIDENEAAGIDSGAAGPGWSRTGKIFFAWRTQQDAPSNAVPVCRFYGTPGVGPNSHFYTADSGECSQVKNDPGWYYEGIAFYVTPVSDGQCANGSTPIYRNYNNRWQHNDSNHRYTSDYATFQSMNGNGWAAEGVVFCAATSTNTGTTSGSACLPDFKSGDTRTFLGSTPMGNVRTTQRFGSSVVFQGQNVLEKITYDEQNRIMEKTYYQIGANEDLNLGSEMFDPATGSKTGTLVFSPSLREPKNLSVGQSLTQNYTGTLNATGMPSMVTSYSSAITLVGYETKTTQAGTFQNTCRFSSDTQAVTMGVTVDNHADIWTTGTVGAIQAETSTTTMGMTVESDITLISAQVGGVTFP